jgi:enterochelin esterase-like enzyme
MRRSWTGWLLRGLAAVIVAAIVALWVLVKPLPECPLPTATPTCVPTPTPTPTTMGMPTPTPTPTITPTPTPNCAETAGRMEQHVYFSQTTRNEEPYRIYLPPCYDQTDHRYPTIYLFHGWPYHAADWDDLGINEAADAGISDGALPPFIIVLPRGSEDMYVNTSGGDHSFEGQIVNDLIPHVDGGYRTRAGREGRAIGGISRGGVWALEIGFRHADIFAAVGAHSPALSVNLAPPAHDPFHLLEEPGVARLHIYLDTGDVDWTRESTQALHETLDKQGIANEFVVHSGDHEKALWSANVVEYLTFYTAAW